jgi:sec-independent protein translocase protein TatC
VSEVEENDAEEELSEGTLLSHLVELRGRLLKIAGTVVVFFVCLLPWAPEIFTMASQPLMEVLPGGKMIATEVASPLITPFKLTFFVALFLGMPVVLYQVWAFVAPGLYKKEKHFAMPLLGSSIVLFYLGIAFASYLVFPLIFKFFKGIAPEGVEVQTDI